MGTQVIAVGDRMFLGMQNLDFWPNLIKFYPNFTHICSNWPKFCPNLPK